MSFNFLDFEKPIAELEAKIVDLQMVSKSSTIDLTEDIKRLQNKACDLTRNIFKSLTDWQIVQLARHPKRPYSLDYINKICTDFDELHGDRNYGDDKAIIGGLAKIDDLTVMIVAQQKGRETKDKMQRNFGMMHPEGYRKALRLFRLAERYRIPVVTLIDTPGAYPGIGAEARGQSEAIAKNIQIMSILKTPIVCVIIGEGCSGGALGIGVGDKILMMQYAYYATISPEGCATILWKSADKASEAAAIMGITATKLLKLNIIDEIIPEPLGGAHRDPQITAENLKFALLQHLKKLQTKNIDVVLTERYKRLRNFGAFVRQTERLC